MYLKELREAIGLSQREIASLAGFEYYTFVSQIETGAAKLPPAQMKRYAEIVKASPREFAITLLRHYEPHHYEMIFTDDLAKRITDRDRDQLASREEEMDALAARIAKLESALSQG
ncbi:helix-turn-helix domain-containing protein [Tianweitania sediminis]|uniref:helix-turn-helix domain-containing protein n=1 Tax=Tianweitania sediminis TaxID=1502156 RepID=UPI001FD784D4|nr:helix-turn-helix transcriptional regulator [Tianweitania sediminis]